MATSANLNGPQQAGDGMIHVAQMRGIGQQVAQPRGQETGRLGDADAALRQEATDDLGQAVPLGDRRREAGIGGALMPTAAADRPLDSEK